MLPSRTGNRGTGVGGQLARAPRACPEWSLQAPSAQSQRSKEVPKTCFPMEAQWRWGEDPRDNESPKVAGRKAQLWPCSYRGYAGRRGPRAGGGTVGTVAVNGGAESAPPPAPGPGAHSAGAPVLVTPHTPPARAQCRVPHTPQPAPHLAASWRGDDVRLGRLPRGRG